MKSNYQYNQEIVQIKRIQNYFQGLLSPDQMHELEKEALEDPFLQDAMDGYQVARGVHDFKISLLQKRLSERIHTKQEEKNLFYFTSHRLAIASLAAVLFILGILLYWMKNEFTNQKHQTEKIVDVELNKDISKIEISATHAINSNFEPESGWQNFSDYLTNYQKNAGNLPVLDSIFENSNTKILSVHLLLTTDMTGKIKKIEYLNPTDHEMQRILNRLIIEGPTWKGKQGEAIILFKKSN